MGRLARYTGVDETTLALRTALVTGYLVAMQFFRRAMSMVDLAPILALLAPSIGGMIAEVERRQLTAQIT